MLLFKHSPIIATGQRQLIHSSGLSLMLLLGGGCKTAEFAGQHEYETLGQLKCAVTPTTDYPSATFKISISGIDTYHGRIERTIRPQNSAATSETITVIQEPGKPLVKEGAGSATSYKNSQAGDYEVDVKTLDYVDLQGSCGFKILKPCKQGMSRTGGYVAFVVDNSESHNVSDCPNRHQIGIHPVNKQDHLYECRKGTARERAVNYATQILGSFGENNAGATSFVSFALFPQMNKDPRWYNATKDRQILRNDLKLLRRPLGVTPYHEGLSSGIRIFASLTGKHSSGDKPRILLFITDGFPTDKDPQQTLQLAQQLKSQHQVKIISVMVTGKSNQDDLRTKHQTFMRGFPMIPKPWMHARYNGSFEPYFLHLLGDGTDNHPGLLAKMSDEVIYIEDSQSLPKAIDQITAREALGCR